jgi:hypothetical protein
VVLAVAPLLPVFTTELVVVVVVVVVVVGAVVPFELQATDSRPTATATMPTVDGALLRICAVLNANAISLSSQSYDVTVRFRRQVTEPRVGLCVELPVSRPS